MSDTFTTIDLFAGGGGASCGSRAALGIAPRVAINHDPAAIQMHAANHPGTLHLCESIWDVAPFFPGGRPIDLLWASPSCTHFSRAKGGAPLDAGIRSLADAILPWASVTRPRVILVENVTEWADWGPLLDDGKADKARKGEHFRRWVGELEALGYVVEWRALVAADYGAPTTRKRLFLAARCDGQPIRWPEPTHGPARPLPWRTAAECIDWTIPCPSIFDRSRPLADATLRRVAAGVVRYVLEDPAPFIAPLRGTSRSHTSTHPIDAPLSTVSAGGTHHALVAPTLIQTGYGEAPGQAPRVLDLAKPLGVVVAGGAKHALVSAFLAKHYGGVVGHRPDRPLGAVTTVDHHSPVTVDLEPEPADLDRARQVAAFLVAYYGSEKDGQSPRRPLRTVPTVDRFGLVTVEIEGWPYVVADIGLRMLQPRELARAQGFPDSYILTGNKREQVARIGNSVCPPVVEALVRAQFPRGPVWVQPALWAAA